MMCTRREYSSNCKALFCCFLFPFELLLSSPYYFLLLSARHQFCMLHFSTCVSIEGFIVPPLSTPHLSLSWTKRPSSFRHLVAPLRRHLDLLFSFGYPPSLSCYASPSSREAYCDRQFPPNFELRVEFFLCQHTCEDSKTMSVCLSVPQEKKSP